VSALAYHRCHPDPDVMSDPQQVQVEDQEQISDGYLKVTRYQLRHEQYSGGWTDTLSREVMERGEVAAVLPFDPARQEVILIEQFRVGAWSARWPKPWLLECIAGIIEPGESPEEMVRREAREEAGCDITVLEPVAHYFSTPGACSEKVDLFCGRVDTSGLGGIHGLAEEGEDIRASVWPITDALELLDTGRICNSMTLIALQWLARYHRGLTHKWLQGD